MKKYIPLLFIVIFILFLVLFLIGLFVPKYLKKVGQIGVSPTPTPFSGPGTIPTSLERVYVAFVEPKNNSANVPLNQTVQITFNTQVAQQDISFTIQPNIPFALDVEDNKLFVTFTTPLTAHTKYIYTISLHKGFPPQSFSFITADASSPIYKDNAAQVNAEWAKTHQPDLYLYNNVPHTEQTFSVTGDYAEQPTGHFYFQVHSIGIQGRNDFLAWIKSLGLTDDQIAQLDIRYN